VEYINWLSLDDAPRQLKVFFPIKLKSNGNDVDAHSATKLVWSSEYEIARSDVAPTSLNVTCHLVGKQLPSGLEIGYVLRLACRTNVQSGDLTELERILEWSREVIVESFTQITTNRAHKSWKRIAK
jgi:hypothetical protein